MAIEQTPPAAPRPAAAPRPVMASAQQQRLLRMTRALSWLTNAIERRTQGANFVVSDLTAFEVIHREDLMTVRRYRRPDSGHPAPAPAGFSIPVVMVPPLAASPAIFDLMPERSLVGYFLARGFAVYLIDWGAPDAGHRRLGLSAYVTRLLPSALDAVRRDAGVDEVSLLGYCLGGLFGLMYAGWATAPGLRNLVTIASPIDFRQAGLASVVVRLVDGPARLVRRYTRFRLHDLDPRWLQVPGWFSVLAFKLTNPLSGLQAYWDLLLNLWDRDYVTRYQTTAAWFNHMHAYPGALVQDLFVRALVDNDFATGCVPLDDGARADFSRVTCACLAVAGEADNIVPVDVARGVLDLLGSTDKAFATAPGGHAGVFGGARAPATSWRVAAEFLAARSGPADVATPTKKASPEGGPLVAPVGAAQNR